MRIHFRLAQVIACTGVAALLAAIGVARFSGGANSPQLRSDIFQDAFSDDLGLSLIQSHGRAKQGALKDEKSRPLPSSSAAAGSAHLLENGHDKSKKVPVLETNENGADSNYSLPLNSALPRTESWQVTMDRVLLLCVLALPCVVFLLLDGKPKNGNMPEAAPEEGNSPEEHGFARQITPATAALRRRGTDSHLNQEDQIIGNTGPKGTIRLFNRMPDEEKEPEEGTLRNNILSGVVIALGCLPEAISFSFLAGISPLNGLWAGVFMGLYSSLLGGRPGMISCASAATAIVLQEVTLDPQLGLGALGLTVFIAGLLQLLAAYLNLSRFVALVPHTVMLGFVNGLAIVIFLAQLKHFRIDHGNGPWAQPSQLVGISLIIIVCMLSATLCPRIPRVGKLLPGPFAAVSVSILFSLWLAPWYPPRTLADVAGGEIFAGGFASMPAWNFPPAGVDYTSSYMWTKVLTTAVRMALVGLVESLLTVKLIDQMTSSYGSTRRECFAQGLGNLACSVFGTQGGCALIGQSLINIGSGARGRLSGFLMASGLALSIVCFAPVVAHIPVGALVGVMFLVSINTFSWGSIGLLRMVQITDAATIVLVTVITVFFDLATAVLAGLFLSALTFAWSRSTDADVQPSSTEKTRTFTLTGVLFFGSAMSYVNKIRSDEMLDSHQTVLLDFSHPSAKVLDLSALNAITSAAQLLVRDYGKTVQCKGLSEASAEYVLLEVSEVEILDAKSGGIISKLQ